MVTIRTACLHLMCIENQLVTKQVLIPEAWGGASASVTVMSCCKELESITASVIGHHPGERGSTEGNITNIRV